MFIRGLHHVAWPIHYGGPLVVRAVGPFDHSQDVPDYASITSGSLYLELFLVHDPRWPHPTSLIWCVRDLYPPVVFIHSF